MPRHHNLAAGPVTFPGPPEESAQERLTGSVSAASVSFVACGAAISDLGDLLRDLRLALEVNGRQTTGPEGRQAAALLAARLESVRWALDGATAATRGLLEDAFPSAAGARNGRSPAGWSLP